MSWEKFDELKTFAGASSHKKRQRRHGDQQPTKKHKKNNASSMLGACDEGIEGFSSEEEVEQNEQQIKKEQDAERVFAVTGIPKARASKHCINNRNDDLLGDPFSRNTVDSFNNNKPVLSDKLKDAPVPEQQKTTAGAISEFDSSSDDENQETPEELKISSPTPSPVLVVDPEGQPGTPRTGSEWLRIIQPLTSSKIGSPEAKAPLDSAKKKNKFQRSGLAERLQRLMNREKSDKAFWLHKQSERTADVQFPGGDTGTLTVQVLSLHQQCSLHLTRCCVLSDDGGSSQQSPRILDVVFDAATQKQLKGAMTGSVIRIHPPWQKMEISGSPYPVLLCTYLCEKLPTPPGSPAIIDLDSLSEPHLPITRSENSFHALPTSPSRKNFHPMKLLFGEERCGNSSDDTPPEPEAENHPMESRDQKPSADQPTTIVRAIDSQGGCSGARVSFRAVVQRVYRKMVRIARDVMAVSPSQNGMTKNILMRARSTEDKEECRWVLLLQDINKTFCEVEIPTCLLDGKGWSCALAGEGKSFVFTDLLVTQRTNRTRSPGLFSLMDSLWTRADNPSTNKDNSDDILGHEVVDKYDARKLCTPPSCSYLLRAQESSRAVLCDLNKTRTTTNPSLLDLYKQPLLSNLYGLTGTDDVIAPSSRVSCWCRVLCNRPANPGQNDARWSGTQLFVTDASLHRKCHEMSCRGMSSDRKRYCTIDVRASNGLMTSVQDVISHSTGTLLFLKDVGYRVCAGIPHLYADSYTVIQKGSPDPSRSDIEKGEVAPVPVDIYADLMSLSLRASLSPLSENSEVDSLCLVEGIVLGVDEDSACCWLVCPACGSADLVERSGLPYFCSVCQCDVTSPVTKTHLEVYMECESWRQARVRVKLLQSTIENLLPVSYQESEQGYDIECVLGKRLGPLYCYIEHHSGSNWTLKETAMAL